MASDGASSRPAVPFEDVSRAAPFSPEPDLQRSRAPLAADRLVDRTTQRERFVIDLFRLLNQFRATYDPRALDRTAEHATLHLPRLAPCSDPDGVVADAVLLDNELRCQGATTYAAGLPGSPVRSEMEDAFLLVLKAAAAGSERAALGAAMKLGVTDCRTLLACAAGLVNRLGWSTPREPAEAQQISRTIRTTRYGQAQANGGANCVQIRTFDTVFPR